MTGEIARDRSTTRCNVHLPEFSVCSDGVDVLAVGAPERWPVSVTGIEAWDVLSGDVSRRIDRDVQNVQFARPELAAGHVRDPPAVRCPVHVDAVRRTKLVDQHASIACSGIENDETRKGLLRVRFRTLCI